MNSIEWLQNNDTKIPQVEEKKQNRGLKKGREKIRGLIQYLNNGSFAKAD